MKQTMVKICGITKTEDIRIINEYLPEYAGFVFFEKSKRNLTCEKAKALLSQLDEKVTPVAVCVSPSLELVAQIRDLGFAVIQVHGNLSLEVVEHWNGDIWQAVNITENQLSAEVLDHKKVKAYVVDGAKYGGGKTSGWDLDLQKKEALKLYLESLKEKGKRIVFAGGLNPDNVKAAIEAFSPEVVDVSSGVEGDCGKDREKVKKFIEISRV